MYKNVKYNPVWPYALDTSKLSSDRFDPSVYRFRCNRTSRVMTWDELIKEAMKFYQ